MLRKLIRRINSPNRFASTASLVLSLVGMVGLAIWIVSETQKEGFTVQSLSDLRIQMIGLGVILAGFIFMRNIFQDIEDLFFQEEVIRAGIGLSDSQHSYKRLFDNRCKEVIIVGQNMRTLMSDSDFQNHIVALLKNNKNVKVAFICTTPEILKAMSKTIPPAYTHFVDSVTEMRDLYHDRLGPNERDRFSVHFHVGATSLSAMIRDPMDDKRGTIVLTVKWATDREPKNRIFCVVEKWENRALFNRLYGHVPNMTDSETSSLKAMCEKIGVQWND